MSDVTRATTFALAVEKAVDPTTVREVTHDAFNGDATSGGFAFHYDHVLLICGVGGGRAWSVDPGTDEGRRDAVEAFWRVARRRTKRLTRTIDPATLPATTRAAVAALVAGARSVSDLDPGPLADDDERARADHQLVLLRRYAAAAAPAAGSDPAAPPTEADALRIVARHDILVRGTEGSAHPCPLCGTPALGGPRYLRAICDDCNSKTRCAHDRLVTGYNVSLGGGFLARHRDDGTDCDTTTDHRVRVDGRPCRLDEAHMGGVVVEALVPPEVELVRGDITRQEVDAVVNAANSAMRGGGGVDGAIHRAGGRAVLADCIARFPRGLATGDAGWTTAGDLPASRIIHTVGPNYAAGQRDRALLVSCYRRSLEVADEVGARTVAFPLLSAGIYGWPLQDAADAAVETLTTTPSGVRTARIVAFGDEAYDAVARALGSVGSV
jgi:O-acetyl-ADP-ribose deacetylase